MSSQGAPVSPEAAGVSVVPGSGAASAARSGAALLTASMVLFAAMAVLARVAGRQLGPAQLVVLRFAFGGATLAALHATGQLRIRPKNLRLLALRGLFGGSAVLLYFVALERCQDVGTATLLNYVSPIFTTLLAAVFLRERLTWRLSVGVVLAAIGVALVLAPPGGQLPAIGVGEVAGLLSAVLSGFAVVTVRAARATDDAPTILFAFCAGGLLLAAPFAAADWREADATTWAFALGVGATSLVAQLLMTHAFGLVTAGLGALYQLLVPVLAFALGALLLGEPLRGSAVVGGALTLAAVAWAATGGLKPPGAQHAANSRASR